MTSIHSLPPRQDPEAYAKSYATQNGISVDEAKTQLKAKYGEPKAKDESIFTQNSDSTNTSSSIKNLSLDDLETEEAASSNTGLLSFIRNLFGLGNDVSEKDMDYDPDTVAQKYADKNGLTLEEAKTKLGEQFGDPEDRDEEADATSLAGIPKGVDPDEYVKQYATKHNLTIAEAKAQLKKLFGEPKAKQK